MQQAAGPGPGLGREVAGAGLWGCDGPPAPAAWRCSGMHRGHALPCRLCSGAPVPAPAPVPVHVWQTYAATPVRRASACALPCLSSPLHPSPQVTQVIGRGFSSLLDSYNGLQRAIEVGGMHAALEGEETGTGGVYCSWLRGGRHRSCSTRV